MVSPIVILFYFVARARKKTLIGDYEGVLGGTGLVYVVFVLPSPIDSS